MVAISSYSAQILEAYELAARYRAVGTPVVVGGPHVSMQPHEAAQHCDAVAIGEGEPIWRTIVGDCERGQLQQYYGAQFSAFDMNDAPMPAFHLLDPDKYNRLLVQTSRGCPHRCEFCAASILISKKYKQKPAHKVLAEIDAIREIWKRPFIEFADDNSFINKEYWHQLLPELRKRDVRWFAESDLAIANDPRLLSLMYESGCNQVLLGLESPEQAAIGGVELNADWKNKTFAQQRQAVATIQSHGIRVIGCFVLGLDGHGPDIGQKVIDYARELELFDVQVTVQTAFPGTPLYSRLKSQERLIEAENWNKCTLFDINYHPQGMTSEQLRSVLMDLAERLYDARSTTWRRQQFKEKLREVRRERKQEKCTAA
ncbi:MAG: B12-binding domain-containing radical SAM protein, partial [Terriglobales bacterium]